MGMGAPPPVAVTTDDPSDLRARFGAEKAAHLLRSTDADERLRGLERAASLDTPETVALLIQQMDSSAPTKADPRAKIAIARGLAGHVDQPAARAALLLLVGLPTPRPTPERAEADEPSYAPRMELARRIAALALAESGEVHAVEALVAIAANGRASMSPSPGAAAAMAALEAYPPGGSATWAKAMSAGMARLVALTGDLRTTDALLDAAKGTDTTARVAAIEALGALGDPRVLEIASGLLDHDDPRVRIAATTALVVLGAPSAPRAVEALLADDATAGHGLELATRAHGAGVVKALAARAAVAADPVVRSAAVAALGRDPTAEGIEALSALLNDALLRADVADAIARSPSPAAMKAIEHMATTPATRRLAARAYVVRALTRHESSASLERTLADLVRSSDGKDGAVGVFAQIALGETAASAWLDDRDPRVRRAAAMGAGMRGMGKLGEGARTLLTRRTNEKDPPTRTVLGAGLVDGDPSGLVTTGALRSCAHGGGADAPLCTLALARRASPAETDEVDLLLASRDPIIRAHAAAGLAGSEDPTRGGRLAAAYTYEPDPLVRSAIIDALAAVPRDAPSVADTVALAARLDPDPAIRWSAAHLPAVRSPALKRDDGDIAWIHLVEPTGAPPPEGETGALLRADGLAIPIVFDADGDALVPGVPPGSARLLLAPRLGEVVLNARP